MLHLDLEVSDLLSELGDRRIRRAFDPVDGRLNVIDSTGKSRLLRLEVLR
jgi:hypothetical protein